MRPWSDQAFAGFVAATNGGIGSVVAAGNNDSKQDVRNRRVLPVHASHRNGAASGSPMNNPWAGIATLFQ
jgi:hypothetical protein